ncbi:MAG: iron-containing alcohol dehydrogenase [Kiritimatiellaeota bacterium]|nr:iron-containing alcohol dehydrogenase [Kiritimatiellota bacterium]
MNNFEYYNPTRIVFGAGMIAELGRLVPDDAKVLLTYGGGSIKRNGVYAQCMEALKMVEVLEFGGIPPNPTYEVCMRAVDLCRREGITFCLAVGGGSVLDGTKFIAAAVPFEGDPWLFLEKRGEVVPKDALPIGCVLTLPATGSEMNPFAVISKEATREKRAFDSELIQPRFSILDPKTTMSLPRKQVRNGIVDAFVHVCEQYITYPVNTPLQDRQAQAVLKVLIEEGPKTLTDPFDYDARANVMWAATSALNRHLQVGVVQDWSTHMIGHELTAFYGIAHAESLAIVLPVRWRLDKKRKGRKLSQYAREVWGVEPTKKDEEAADEAIDKTVTFFNSLGMPTRLADYGIDARECAQKVRARFNERGSAFGEHGDIDGNRAAEILLQC